MHRELRAKRGEEDGKEALSVLLMKQLRSEYLRMQKSVKEDETGKAGGEGVKSKKRVKQKRGKSFRR